MKPVVDINGGLFWAAVTALAALTAMLLVVIVDPPAARLEAGGMVLSNGPAHASAEATVTHEIAHDSKGDKWK